MTGSRSDRGRRSLAIGTMCVLLASAGAAVGATWLRDCETLEKCAAHYSERAPRMGWAGLSLRVCSGVEQAIEGTERLGFDVVDVSPGSPASTAGIQTGDRVVALNGVEFPVAGGAELMMNLSAGIGIGDRVRYRILRDDRALTFTISMAEPPPSVISRRVLGLLALRFGPREMAKYLEEHPLEPE